MVLFIFFTLSSTSVIWSTFVFPSHIVFLYIQEYLFRVEYIEFLYVCVDNDNIRNNWSEGAGLLDRFMSGCNRLLFFFCSRVFIKVIFSYDWRYSYFFSCKALLPNVVLASVDCLFSSKDKWDNGWMWDNFSFINNISETTTMKLLNLSQYFVLTLYVYVCNGRLKIHSRK